MIEKTFNGRVRAMFYDDDDLLFEGEGDIVGSCYDSNQKEACFIVLTDVGEFGVWPVRCCVPVCEGGKDAKEEKI